MMMSLLESTRSNDESEKVLGYCRFCAAQIDQEELMDLTLVIHFGKSRKVLDCLKLEADLADNTLPQHACKQCFKNCLDYFDFCLLVKRTQKLLSYVPNHQ